MFLIPTAELAVYQYFQQTSHANSKQRRDNEKNILQHNAGILKFYYGHQTLKCNSNMHKLWWDLLQNEMSFLILGRTMKDRLLLSIPSRD